jgi:NAD(P)-dependent dehydrogenase (short-subunit alcohol dehydrogenase family)
MEALLRNKNQMDSKSFILITGASSGIGQHIAINLSSHYNLVLNGRNDETLSKVIEQCANKKNHLKWVYDLKNIEGIEDSLRVIIDENILSFDGFIHCAGVLKMLPLKSISLEHLQETISVNFSAAVFLIKALISKKINNSKLKNVIFISSTASIRGAKAFNIYSGSKGAVDALMRSLAVELAPNVRLNSILPGAIQTKMTENMFNDKELLEKMKKDYPLGLGELGDIFEMVNFLLSEKSKWITGQQFVIDGGRSINISA